MYSITITITCNHKNQRLQITFRLLKTCNRLHVITITDYNYNRSGCNRHLIWFYTVSSGFPILRIYKVFFSIHLLDVIWHLITLLFLLLFSSFFFFVVLFCCLFFHSTFKISLYSKKK